MKTYVVEKESTDEIRQLTSQPDFIYGWIPPQYMPENHEIPIWSRIEAEAVNGTDLLYPFLVVKFGDLGIEQSASFSEPVSNCIQGASIGVRMAQRLRHRLAERGYHDAGSLLGLNSSVYSFVLIQYTAFIFFSYAWDETSEHFCPVGILDLRNEESQRECERLISCILIWGTTTRLESIQKAIQIIRSNNLGWYPRYQQEN
jgi:hypothetical protein